MQSFVIFTTTVLLAFMLSGVSGGCTEDKNKYCCTWASKGYCSNENYREYMEQTCCLSCNASESINIPPPPETCVYKGKHYPINERFIPDDCSGVCKCKGNKGFGCVSLCPPVGMKCKPGMELEYYRQPVGDSGCFCERPRCKRVDKNRIENNN
uniref:Toxin candidate TRINITY_DN5150_c0_g1_i1 n=1 Tax=Ceriantheomorphe brasiliensis TaxID=1048506 RepID=A0A7G7WZ33_9CNID|nr:toxin candidate TRINITY_DN5150_c0_g1_i1 [Ceriantheomorphe brasiliensis]